MEQEEKVRRVITYLIDNHKRQFVLCSRERRTLVIKKIMEHPKMQYLFEERLPKPP